MPYAPNTELKVKAVQRDGRYYLRLGCTTVSYDDWKFVQNLRGVDGEILGFTPQFDGPAQTR